MGMNFFSYTDEIFHRTKSRIKDNGFACINEDDFINDILLNDQKEFLYTIYSEKTVYGLSYISYKKKRRRWVVVSSNIKVYSLFGSINTHPTKIDTYKKLYKFFISKIAKRLSITNGRSEKIHIYSSILFKKQNLYAIFNPFSEIY